MMTRAAVILLTLGMAAQASAQEAEFLARFDGGIGVIPVGLVVNTVRGIAPAPGPWRIASLRADIDIYGRIKVRGRGLLIANGDFIGTNFNQRVFATLSVKLRRQSRTARTEQAFRSNRTAIFESTTRWIRCRRNVPALSS